MSLAIIGFYAVVFTIYKIMPKKKTVAAIAAPVQHDNHGGVPSVDSPEFGVWLEGPGNIERLLA